MKKLNILIVLIVVVGISFGFYNFYHPIKYTNACNDKDVYRYRFGIFQLTKNIVDKIEEKKIGGIAEYLGLKKTKCIEELEKEYYSKLKIQKDSANTAQKWRELKSGLWINKYGDIAFKSQAMTGLEYEPASVDVFISNFGFNESPPLKTVIDTLTFTQLGYTFFKDKNHIYHYYAMSDGGSFNIYEVADLTTFHVIGGCYAKDKNHIYHERSGIIEGADYKTFKKKKSIEGCFAKDKFGYFAWGDRIKKEDMNDEYVQKAIKELNR